MPASRQVHVVLADHQALFREGVRSLLQTEDGMLIAGEAGNAREALRLTEQLQPDILLLDWAIPGMGGAEMLRELAARRVSARVIILTEGIDTSELRTISRAPRTDGPPTFTRGGAAGALPRRRVCRRADADPPTRGTFVASHATSGRIVPNPSRA